MPTSFSHNAKGARVVVDANGIHVTTDDGENDDPRAAFKQRLADAWRGGPDRAVTQTLDHIKRKQQLSEAWKHDDAGGPYGVTPGSKPDAASAYARRSQQLASAWQMPIARPPRVTEAEWLQPQKRKYRPGLASYDPAGDSADDAVHLDDADAAQQRRDEAQQRYVDRVANAWKG